MTSKHVEEEVKSSSCPSCLGEYAWGSSHLLIERIDSHKPRYVLEEDYELQHVLRVQSLGLSHTRDDYRNHHLWKRKHGKNVDDEMWGQVTFSDLAPVLNKNTSPKYTRRRSDEARTELENHVNGVEDIGDGAQNASGCLHFLVDIKAVVGLVEDRDVEEQRVDGDSDDTS